MAGYPHWLILAEPLFGQTLRGMLPSTVSIMLLARILKDMCREMEANPQFFDSLANSRMSDQPDVCTDDSCVVEELSGIGSGGCGLHAHRSGLGWFGCRW